jgi:hypothetical protein
MAAGIQFDNPTALGVIMVCKMLLAWQNVTPSCCDVFGEALRLRINNGTYNRTEPVTIDLDPYLNFAVLMSTEDANIPIAVWGSTGVKKIVVQTNGTVSF